MLGKAIEHEHHLFDLLRRPGVSHAALMTLPNAAAGRDDANLTPAAIEQVEIAAKYAGYIDRQKDEVARAAHFENLRLPPQLDYMQVTALSIERAKSSMRTSQKRWDRPAAFPASRPPAFRCC